ncbi:hypothetical protein B0H11DRAFT_1912975 [Mycena galericulata]|nr:hypothetical protein B0H11DRAFT_1912975 [Mycena galericulata]
MHIRLSDHKVAEVGVDGKETAVPNIPADEIIKLEESGTSYLRAILVQLAYQTIGPYSGLNSEEESFGSYYERMEQEPLRATWNQKLCQLRLSRDNIKHQNAHIVDPRDRLDANFPAIQAYSKSKSDYQDIFGRFVPDSENAAWFAKINPRIEQMLVARQTAANIDRHDHADMVKYFAAARAFEDDFGHPFTAHDADDGLDEHFKRMAFQTSTAAKLQELGDAWTSKVISEPLTFTLKNPYPEGDQRRLDFDVKLRLFKRTLEGEAAVDELPSNVLADFPFSLGVTDLQSYYDAVYTQHKLFCKEIHHWEYFNDDIGEKRDGRGLTPFPLRPPLCGLAGNWKIGQEEDLERKNADHAICNLISHLSAISWHFSTPTQLRPHHNFTTTNIGGKADFRVAILLDLASAMRLTAHRSGRRIDKNPAWSRRINSA